MDDLLARLGNIDIYLFDQLLKGRIEPGRRILNAGCGGGRNIAYLLGTGCDVYCVDRSQAAIQACSRLVAELRPDLPAGHIRHEPVERLSFESSFFDLVIASALLHFAEDEDHFEAMLRELWRVLQPGGLFFARLASSRCLADQIQWIGPRKRTIAGRQCPLCHRR